MATPLAEAYADLRLSDGKFSTDLAGIVARLQVAVQQMERIAKVDVSAVGTVTLNTSAAQSQITILRNQLTALGQVQSQLDVRSTRIEEAKTELTNLRTLLVGLNDDKIVVDPVVATAEAETSLSRLQLLIAEITGEPAIVNVDVTDANAIAQLEEVSTLVQRLDTENANITVNATGVTQTKEELASLDATAQEAASDRGGMSNFEKRLILFTSTAALAGIFKLGESITKFGLDTSATLESTEVSFQNILGSASAATDVFNNLKKFSVPAPFDTTVLAGVAKQLLAIGDTADQVVPDVRTLAGVVTLFANSDPNAFGRLTLALGQIGSSTRPLAPDLRQITQAIPGFNAQLQLAAGVARDFGISVDDAEDKIASGGVTGADGMRILLEQMQRFPGAASAISTQAQTLQGKLSQFRDTVKLNLSDAFAGLANELKDALGPLSDSVDVAFKQIGPDLAQSLSVVLPTLGPLIEQLGAAFGPALGGFAEGIAGTLTGLVPTLQAVLPALGQTFQLFGQFVENLGPSLGATAGALTGVLIPAFQTLDDVIGAIPTPVLTTLLTTLLAFRGLSFIKGIFDDMALSLQKAELRASGLTSQSQELKTATGDYSNAAKEAALATAGFFSGLAASSDDAVSKISGVAGAIASIAVASSIDPLAGAATAATSALGLLIGNFEKGKTKADALQKSVDALAKTITGELQLAPGQVPDLGEVVASKAFGTTFEDKLKTNIRGALARSFDIHDSDTLAALSGSQQGFEDFINQFIGEVNTKTGKFTAPKFELPSADDQNALISGLQALRIIAVDTLDAAKDSTDAAGDATTRYYQKLLAVNAAWDNTGPVNSFIDANKLALNSFDDQVAAVTNSAPPVKALTDQYQDMAAAMFGLSPAFASLAENLNIDAALDRVKKAADGVKTTFSDLLGSLDATIQQQNLQFELDNLGKSITDLVGEDKFEAAQQKAQSLNDQIQNQEERIADLKSDLAAKQAQAVIDGADFDRRIAEAEAAGSVTGLAALRAARSQVGADADKAARDLDKAQRTITDLQGQLSGLDVTTPKRLIDIVKAQAKAAGADLWQFLLDGPTKEAQQLYQDTLGSVVTKAFSDIQNVDTTQGPQAAISLVTQIQGTLHDQLLKGGFAPGTADEIVKNMLNPDKLKQSLTDELNANLDAATAAASKDANVKVGVTFTDIEAALTKLQTAANAAAPIQIPIGFFPSTVAGSTLPGGHPGSATPITDLFHPPVVPDFADSDKQTFLHLTPDFADLDRQLATHEAMLVAPVAPDFADADRQLATHKASFNAIVNALFDGTQNQLDGFDGTLTAQVVPDLTLLDQALAAQRTITVSIEQDPNQILQVSSKASPTSHQADGGVLQFFRQGGFSRQVRDAPHVAQFAPAGAWRVWAEPETGGEGYVPLAPSKRDRSTEIVRTIADMFGYRLEPKVDVYPAVTVTPKVEVMSNLTVPSAAAPQVTVNPTVDTPAAQPTINLTSLMPSLTAGVAQVPYPDRKTLIGPPVAPHTILLPSAAGSRMMFDSNDARRYSNTAVTSHETASSIVNFTNLITSMSNATRRDITIHPARTGATHLMFGPAPTGRTVFFAPPSAGGSVAFFGAPPGQSADINVHPFMQAATVGLISYVNVDPKVIVGPTSLHTPTASTSISSFLERVRDLVVDRTIERELDRTVRETFGSTVDRTTSFGSTLNQQLRSMVVERLTPGVAPDVYVVADRAVGETFRPLPGNTQVKVTAQLDDDRIVNAVDRLIAALSAPSPYADRRARAESHRAVIQLAEGAIVMKTENPRRGLRDLVDELTRMAH